MSLRAYQVEAVDQIWAARGSRPLLVAPTGSGKTVMAGELIRREVEAGGRVVFVAHTREIIQQTATRLAAEGQRVGVVMGQEPSDPGAPVQVASIQTLGARIDRGLPAASLVIVDEAHHIRAATYETVVDRYTGSGSVLVGLTATPIRSDGKGLGEWFGELVQTVDVPDLIETGFLADFRFWVATPPDLASVKVRAGEYAPEQLEEVMTRSEVIGDVVDSYLRHLSGRTCLVFCVSIQHSKQLAERFLGRGIEAAHVDGTTPKPERDAVFAALAGKRIRVVTNVALVSEGFDAPSLDGVILARPTKSLGLARQQMGRVLRPPGPVVIVDHAGVYLEHGLPDAEITWSLDLDRPAVKGAAVTKVCPECGAVIPGGVSECPECGAEQARRAVVQEHVDATLVEVRRTKKAQREMAAQAKRQAHEDMVTAYAKVLLEAHRGKRKMGWAHYRWTDRREEVVPVRVKREALARHFESSPQHAPGECRFCASSVEWETEMTNRLEAWVAKNRKKAKTQKTPPNENT